MVLRLLKRLVMALVVAILLLAGLELLLRAFVAPPPELRSPLPFQRIDDRIITSGRAEGTLRYWIGRFPTALHQRVGLRIVLVGSSAAYGEKVTPYTAFGGWIQRYLVHLFPGRPIEVLNLGAGGVASRHVAELLGYVLRYERPDLILVYTGNNEFHELRGLKKLSPHFDARAERMRRLFSRYRLYRHLRDLLVPPQPTKEVPRLMPDIGTLEIEVDEADRQLVTLLYEESLTRMARMAKAAGVPLLLSTIADNQRELYDLWNDKLIPGPQLALLKELKQAHPSPDALLRWIAEHDLELQSAAAQGQLGQLLLQAGQAAEARKHLERSEYLDPRPSRSNVALRAVVKKVAEKRGVGFCDAAARLGEQAAAGIPGYEFFLDSCHFNARGNEALGRILLSCMLEQSLLPEVPSEEVSSARSKLEEVHTRIANQQIDPYRVDHWPGPLDPSRIVSREPAALTFVDTPEGLAEAGHQAFAAEMSDLAMSFYARSLLEGGEEAALTLSIGLAQRQKGDWEEAKRSLEKAVTLQPDDGEVRNLRLTMGK